MSAEIFEKMLVKAKGLCGKDWREGYYWFCQDTLICIAADKDRQKNEHHYILFDGLCDWNMPMPHYKMDIDPDTLCRYTGMMDTESHRIFEHDICKDSAGSIIKIVWDKYGWYGEVIDGSSVLSKGLRFPLWQWDHCAENDNRTLTVIGNTFDGYKKEKV